MVNAIRTLYQTSVRVFVIYLILSFFIVALTSNLNRYATASSKTNIQRFKNDYLSFVVSQPSKLKNTIKKAWQDAELKNS